MATNLLGEYLRARRARVSAETAGVLSLGARRVPGLRREEVAALAGLSVDYYVRLEQGRERHPSAQVVAALSEVLRLDVDARKHLHEIAGARPSESGSSLVERVDPQLRTLMDSWPDTPALVLGKAYDVLAANALAHALFGGLTHRSNLLLRVFLDPGARSFYPHWDQVAASTVAGFRVLHGRMPTDSRIREVLAEASRRSPAFVRLWEAHDARGKQLSAKSFHHPEVGELDLVLHAFEVRSTPSQELVVYHAEEGSPSARALALLGSSAATRVHELSDSGQPPSDTRS